MFGYLFDKKSTISSVFFNRLLVFLSKKYLSCIDELDEIKIFQVIFENGV